MKGIIMNLEQKDIEVLIDALDAWERADGLSGIMAGMLGGVLSKNKDEAASIMDEVMAEAEEKTKGKKEISAMIKAKLYIIKEKLSIPVTEESLRCI